MGIVQKKHWTKLRAWKLRMTVPFWVKNKNRIEKIIYKYQWRHSCVENYNNTTITLYLY